MVEVVLTTVSALAVYAWLQGRVPTSAGLALWSPTAGSVVRSGHGWTSRPPPGPFSLVMDPTDEQLMAQLAGGHEDALRELHRRYAPYLFALGRRMLSGTDDLEACVQDAFISIWRHAARFDPSRASFKTWLITIARRRFLQALRDRKDATLPLEDWDAPTAAAQPLDRIMLGSAVATLDGEQQHLIDLAFYSGYSHQQLADVTGLPLGTVKTKLRTALGKLRAHFENDQPDGGQADGGRAGGQA